MRIAIMMGVGDEPVCNAARRTTAIGSGETRCPNPA
jgi:hypothetical protein